METTTESRWLISDGPLWATFTDVRREEIKHWLLMHGIRPSDVPVDCEVWITDESGTWEIRYEVYRRSDNGMIMIDPSNPDEAYVRECSTPLEIDPPSHWLIPMQTV
jgi:hypothetical protein